MIKVKILGLVNKWRSKSAEGSKERKAPYNFSGAVTQPSPTSAQIQLTDSQHLTDTGLLANVIQLWQKRNFNALAKIDIEQVKLDKHRATILLLMAASHQWLENYSKSKTYTLLAYEWSIDKGLLKRFLVSEAWFKLAICYQAAGLSNEADRHLQEAIKSAPFDSGLTLAFETYSNHTSLPNDRNNTIFGEENSAAVNPIKVKRHNTDSADQLLLALLDKIDKQNTLLRESTEAIKKTFKSELDNNAQQIEAFLDLQNFFNHGRHLPKMHGWPISPDLALYLVDIINSNSYDVVIEFGSGTSTVLIAQALSLKNKSNSTTLRITKQVAFEHLPEYHEKTKLELKNQGLEDKVNLELTPLKMLSFPGGEYYYYTCEETLQVLSETLEAHRPRILSLVDGPPAKTGKHARYPALPVLLKYFPQAEIDIILDDFARPEEKGVVGLWTAILEECEERNYKLDAKRMEKDACLISIKNTQN